MKARGSLILCAFGVVLATSTGGHAGWVAAEAFTNQGSFGSIGSASFGASTGPAASDYADTDYPAPPVPFAGINSGGCLTIRTSKGLDAGCGTLSVTVDPLLQSAKITGSVPSFLYRGSYRISVSLTVTVPQTAAPTPLVYPEDLINNCDPPEFTCPGTSIGVGRVGRVSGSISSARVGSSSGTGNATVYADLGAFGILAT